MLALPDGTRMNYYVDDLTDPWKESDTIVICHGCFGTGRLSFRMAAALLRTYKIIRIDERGHGQSSVSPSGYYPSLELFAEDVIRVIDHLGIGKINFFGFASGGWVGMKLAILYPDRIKSLILCNSPHKSPRYRSAGGSAPKEDVAATIKKLGVREWVKTIESEQDAQVAPEVREWIQKEKADNCVDIAAARFQWSLEIDVWDLLPDIKIPALIITGSKCKLVPLEMAVAMKKRIPDAQVAVVENGGSALYFTMPERCAEIVSNFLRNLE